MEIRKTELPGVMGLKWFHHEDDRGVFNKFFHETFFQEHGIKNFHLAESYMSISKKNVLRGMHLQLPPYDHDKIVFCVQGEILDVVVNLKADDGSYGQYTSMKLGAEKATTGIYIPAGFAHGFLTLSDQASVLYFTSSVHNKQSDAGIRWDSFGFSWPTKEPILSDRDVSLPTFQKFSNTNGL